MTIPAVYDFDALYEATRPVDPKRDPDPVQIGMWHGSECRKCQSIPKGLLVKYANPKILSCIKCGAEFRYV